MDTVLYTDLGRPQTLPKSRVRQYWGEQPAERREGPEPQASTLGEFFEGQMSSHW